MKAARGASNGLHERDRVRVTVIIIRTVVTYLVRSSGIRHFKTFSGDGHSFNDIGI